MQYTQADENLGKEKKKDTEFERKTTLWSTSAHKQDITGTSVIQHYCEYLNARSRDTRSRA